MFLASNLSENGLKNAVSGWTMTNTPLFISNGNNDTYKGSYTGWIKFTNGWIYFYGSKAKAVELTTNQPTYTPS